MDTTPPHEGLPDNAKLVFKGVIFEVWQWEQEMYDGSTKTFEKTWRPPTIEVIASIGDRILIGHQEQPTHGTFISLFGGRPENDDIEAEARRELLEETGYVSDDWQLLLKKAKRGHTIHQTYVFIARDCRKEREQSLDAGEKISVEAVSFKAFLDLSEDPKAWICNDLIEYLREVRKDENKKREFRRLLFP